MRRTTRWFAVLVLVLPVALLHCRGSEPLAVTAAPGNPDRDLLGWLIGATGLVVCSPLPADSVSQTVGPEGGVITVGAHTLSIPPDAVAEPVVISAVAPSDTVARVRFAPEGLEFRRSAVLTMSYANCGLLGTVAPKRIAFTTDALEILDLLGSMDNRLSQTVTARLQHFSNYAIAW